MTSQTVKVERTRTRTRTSKKSDPTNKVARIRTKFNDKRDPSPEDTPQKKRGENKHRQKVRPRKNPSPINSISSCESRIRGFSNSDLKCCNCIEISRCQTETMKRLMSLSQNLNREIFDQLEDYDLPEEYWRDVGLAEKKLPTYSDDDFDEIRKNLIDTFGNWFRTYDLNIDYISSSVKGLRKSSRTVLKSIFSDWKKLEDLYLDTIHVPDINDLDQDQIERGGYHTRFPWWVSDNQMSKMTGNQWKIFCYIVRRCTFDPNHQNFGTCWLGYEQIIERTGVKVPGPAIKALAELGLIELIQDINKYGSIMTTTNHFSVNFFYQMVDSDLWKVTKN